MLWIAAFFVLAYAGLIGVRVLYPIDYIDALESIAANYDLDPALVAAVVCAESRFAADARSPQGAVGLMQIMPTTGSWIAEQLAWEDFDGNLLLNPTVNLRFGSWYLAYLVGRFATLDQVLVAYNAGPSIAEQWSGNVDTLCTETAQYVSRVRSRIPIYRVLLRWRFVLRITPSILGLRR